MNSNSNVKIMASQRLRAYARVELSGEVLIHDEEELYIVPLLNLSAGGCFVEKIHCISKGSEVKIVVRSKRLQFPIQAKGVVVRIEKEDRVGLAIEFTSISQEARDSIQTLIYENKVQNALKII